MDGFKIAGKAFAVCEDLRQIAEQNKGKTVAEILAKERLKRTVERQLAEIEKGVYGK